MPVENVANAAWDPRIRPIVEEEEALLARVLAARARAEERERRKRRDGESRSVEAYRALRDEAIGTSEDDLPGVLHEMSVRQRLLDRRDELVLPDPATPYLAHMRVREGREIKDYLLGTTSFFDTQAGVRIVDIRVAAIASVFYRYREGDEYEVELPGRVAEGVVLARRVVTITNGVITRIHAAGEVLVREADGVFLASGATKLERGGAGTSVRAFGLGVGATPTARDVPITALLDAEQHAAITVPEDRPLLVLGSAGSGKTTVALHRLAHLTLVAPERFPLARTRVVVPEEGLARLCRRLLRPLGLGDATVQTLDRFSEETFRSVFRVPMPRLDRDTPASVSSLKRHPAFYRAIRERFAQSEHALRPGYRALHRQLVDALSDRAFLSSVVDAAAGPLPRDAIDDTLEHTHLQMADPIALELASIVDPEMKRSIDGRPIDEGTPEALAGSLDVDDLPILLCLRSLHGALEVPSIAQLVLDEAEDVSPFELHVLGCLLARDASVTLAGDEAQRTSTCFESWDATLEWLGVREPVVRRLAISYRCPRPIAELARAVLEPGLVGEPVLAAREGAEVGCFRFDATHQADLFVFEALRELIDGEPHASVALVASDADSARRFAPLLVDFPEARLVTDGAFDFEPGVDVTHVDDVKGLEFDYVIVADASRIAYPDTPLARHRLHVAMTRASHQLWLVAAGTPTPLVADARWGETTR